MPLSLHRNIYRPLALSALALLMTACDDDSTPAASSTATLSGTAAVGAAIVSGTVTAKCANGSGFTAAVTTAANGSWSGQIASAALPCALQVSGGTPAVTLHGFASSAGVVNITPLTDLALALATTQTPATWFAGTPATLNPATLATAVSNLGTALQNGNYVLPVGAFSPFTTAFVIGDAWDQVLDQVQDAIDASGGAIADYAALVELVKGGNLGNLPDAPEGSGGGSATVHASLVSSPTLTFKAGGGEGCGTLCDYAENESVPVVIGSDNTLTVGGKTLSNPFFRSYGGAPHTPELIWLDAEDNIEYALTDNDTGTFNEINVGDAARPIGTFSIPTFLGQLRAPPPSAAAKLIPLAGSYAPLFVEKLNGNFVGNSTLTLGNTIGVVISSSGVVTVDGFTFDPAASGVEFGDFTLPTTRLERSYSLSLTEGSGDTLQLLIYLSPTGEVVSWNLSRTHQTSGGGFVTTGILLEHRPISTEETTLLTTLKNLGDIPLVAVLDDTSYFSAFRKCDQLVLRVTGDGSVASPWTYKLESPTGSYLDEEKYKRSFGRYSEVSGAQRIGFTRQRLVKRDDGTIDVEAIFIGNVKDRATNNAADIAAAACP